MTFDEFGFEYEIMDGLDAMNFREATPIQEKAIPVIMDGHDLIACAQTGTGKTAAFILPLMNRLLLSGNEQNKVKAVIITPTRELAQQIDLQFEGFSYFAPISTVAVSGGGDGASWEQQKRGLTLGADVIIATPGRLISHLKISNIDFSGVEYLILDEADRMLDMGFYDDIMQIVKQLPDTRQTIMFSATMPDKIQKLAANILRNPVEVRLAVNKPAEKIVQTAYVCYEAQKMGIVKSLFRDTKPERVIIFSSSKLKVKEVAAAFKRMKFNVGEMHSDLDQSQRDVVMREFKSGRIDILVATDIVARGIDIDDIRLVINFDVPRDCEDYVHRIGRTARAGAEGCAITFVSQDDQSRFAAIEEFIGREVHKLALPEELGEGPEYNPKKHNGRSKARGRGGKPSRRSGKARGGKNHRSEKKHVKAPHANSKQ